MDRRQRKTRSAILTSCLSLIQEKDFQKITVNEIAERADINRGTYYLHFEDKYDMIHSFEKEMIDKIEYVIVKNLPKRRSNQLFLETRFDTLVHILKCYEANRELLHFLLKANYSSFQTKLRKQLKRIFTEEVYPKLEKLEHDIPVDLVIILLTSLSLSLAEYAYESQMPIDIEQTARFLFNLVLKGPAKTLGLLQDT